MSRPEHIAPPELFYNETEAQKYTSNSRIASVQAEMAFRAIELLCLPEDKSCLLLDIGCGSGLSGEVLEEEGHTWVGLDISPSMLEIARDREVEGDLMLQDVGQGLGFRPGTFEGAISISVLQWLCNADSKTNIPKARLMRFFTTLYSCLVNGSRAVFQFYPENDDQLDLIMGCATRCGFTGGLVIDYPNSKKAKKFYLCLFAGQGQGAKPQLPQGLGTDETADPQGAQFSQTRNRTRGPKGGPRVSVKDKHWIMRKKDAARTRGETVANDSKYTGRKRRVKF
ncbi:18S rRNA (guanine1575-N7)-methyltransferase [Dimargaris cristalligena]|uniref:Williams Beuren syndrome chromosome region 22 n=1 Tax=Dimargaris cristalligena TaxID=215637 RepID=A0A4Q0A1T4_9FUNG|nr:18S rRNA (guanine1575-N7)-methyltransferase [Dimargaris cristalligena]RKP40045.1 williams Beuren syndrome chromosome region 22 [Dimargaris cristalligena]|eukprot:RKP40045.1 williams Beuren syndrome chromosome region 22 [Dimargaris cristalligena]